jgi:cysteine desulfurase/selenocysteine lyase
MYVMLRELFPVTRNLIYLNHAAVGPLSMRACEAMERHARDQRDFGALHWREWYAEHDRVRESAAKLINADADEIAILKNTSEGISFVAEGLRWREGDNVVTTAMEFPSNAVPWKKLERRGVACRIASTAADIEQQIDDRTRIVTVSSVAFHNGYRADLVALGELCKRRNILFCVDAIQSLGVIPMDVRAANITFLAADGHKWLCGPEGAAIFYVAKAHRDELEVLENGWTNIERKGKFIDCATGLLDSGRRFEAGSLNTNGIYGLRAAIDLLLEVGIDVIEQRTMKLARELKHGLESIGFAVPVFDSPIVGAIPPDVERTSVQWLHRKLEEERIVTAPREGLLRFSPHFYNDQTELSRAVSTLQRVIIAA